MFNRKDYFYKKAKEEGFRSRAAYKLLEIQKKYKIFKKGDYVLDLGCAPGGWIQVAIRFIGKNGKIKGIDLLDVKPFNNSNIEIIKGDIFDYDFSQEKFDVIISDMAPNTSGIKHADYFKSYELCETAFYIAKKSLKNHGNLVLKIFQGKEFNELRGKLKKNFKIISVFKPKSSRSTSSETYLVCKDFIKEEA